MSSSEVPDGKMSEANTRDAALAAQVADRDQTAFEELFGRHRSAVKAVAARVLRDEGLAEDVVQETFVGFWNAPARFDPARGSLQSYLVTIAHRRAVDTVRSEVARTRREQAPPDPPHLDVEDEVWSRTISETVRRALDELPETEREAIALAYLKGMSYVEVARRLGQPEGTVKSRIRSGMRRLSASLAQLAR